MKCEDSAAQYVLPTTCAQRIRFRIPKSVQRSFRQDIFLDEWT